MELISGQTVAVLILGGLFVLGGLLGCGAAGSIHGEGADALKDYLHTYLVLAEEGTVPVSFGQVLWGQMKYPVMLVLLGFTALGVIGIPVLFSVRGFLFAFSVACFCRVFGAAGLLPALFLFGLPAILWVPAFFVLGFWALQTSRRMLNRYMGVEQGKEPAEKGPVWAACIASGIVCGGLEYFVLPVLLGASAGVLV